MRILLAALVLAVAVLGGLVATGVLRLPPRLDPFAPLDLAAEDPGPLAGWKLMRLQSDPEACLAAFDAAGLEPRLVPDLRPPAEGCGYGPGAMRLAAGGAVLSPPGPVVSCPLAAAWTMFERQVLQPAARRHFGQGVAAVRHLGSYNCRNVNHAASGRRSQHARANAIDVAGVTLADGRQVSVLRHWAAPGPEGAFLREIRDGACRWFRAVLGPEYNAAHRDHFHLDRGPWWVCR
jgi:hypothetical protein